MHHVRRHFQKSPDVLETFDDKPRLPTELLIHIASYIRRRRDLLSLCRVSKKFRDICTPLLYRVVEIDTSGARPRLQLQLHLYKALQGTILSQHVTQFSVKLVGDKICPRRNNIYFVPSGLRRCSCDGYDRALGEALISLQSLQYLSLQCGLCSQGHTHDYLFQLDAPRLRQFAFRCFGSSKPSLNSRNSILQVSFMPNVLALALECDGRRILPPFTIFTGSFGGLIARPDVAPHLHTLSHDGSNYSNSLLAARPIQRLCINSMARSVYVLNHWMLHRTLVESPGKLTHLLSFDLLQWLPDAISDDVEPYRHLRFIGTITLFECDETALVQMEKLSPLCNLEVIEINTAPWAPESSPRVPKVFRPERSFFERLEHQHRLLYRVLLTHRHQRHSAPPSGFESFMWEKGSVWERHSAPYLEYWDILCDRSIG